MARRILQPLGLERTVLPGDEVELPEPHAHGYWPVDGGKLLADAEQEAMQTVVTTDDSFGYGLGIERRTLPGGRVVWGHTGGILGYLTLSHRSDELQLTLSYTGMSTESPETAELLGGLLN